MDVVVPNADWLTRIVTLGPPVLLVIGLLIILQSAARNKIDIKRTGILSGIVAGFFLLWIFMLPELRTRRIEIVSPMSPKQLASIYSLQPIQYRIERGADAKDTDLDSLEFPFPDDSERLRLHFNLDALIRSYEQNLRTIIQVAQNDPACFEEAIKGNTYAAVAANIKETCPGSLRRQRPDPSAGSRGPAG
jgi:hypothetical protein